MVTNAAWYVTLTIMSTESVAGRHICYWLTIGWEIL